MKKKAYVSPNIKVYFVKIEECIANSSVVSIGGADGSGYPDIFEQEVEERPFEIEF